MYTTILQGGSKSENLDIGQEGATDALPANTLKRRPSRAVSLPQKRAKPDAEGRAVRSQSQAALALLASAAGDVFPSSSDLQEPPPSLKTELPPQANTQEDEGRGVGGGSVNLLRKASLDLSIDGGDDEFSLLNTAGLDEKELKKLRRKQSNRESARRSRLKKQDECDTLQRENRQLREQIQQLMNDKIEMTAQMAILNAKLSMAGVFGTMQQQQQQQQPPAQPPAAMMAAMAAAAAAGAQPPQPTQPSQTEDDDDDDKTES
jgi:hypothetical protein